jgi:hypothetical protein
MGEVRQKGHAAGGKKASANLLLDEKKANCRVRAKE